MAKKIDPPKALPPGRQAPEKIAPTATEISVARNGLLKPYAVCFQHLPDNIAREPLGLLAGVMTINDRSENSAYIVNFLASLAKKEYYGNPRRGAIESFEASLHKINIGLAELAKEGSTEWIGMLDAALCIVERNNLHFSVAGKARVLLFRDHHLSDISDGLSDGSDDHPMKTFTDVASGKISPGDRIIITTPEIFSVLSETELERSANRLPNDQFERFLRTAVVNKLDLSASVLINIETIADYERQPAPKRTFATIDSVPNAWSHTIFEASKQCKNSVEDGLKEKKESERDRIDDKTGHIYVTGEAPGEEPNETWEHLRLFLGDAEISLRRAIALTGKSFFSGMASLSRSLSSFFTNLALTLREFLREWHHKRKIKKSFQEEHHEESALTSKMKRTRSETPPGDAVTLEETSVFIEKWGRWSKYLTILSEKTVRVTRSIPRPSFPKRSVVHIPIQDGSTSRTRILQYHLHKTRESCFAAFQNIAQFIATRSRKQKFFLAAGCASALVILIFFLFFQKLSIPKEADLQTALQTSAPETLPPLSNDASVHFLESTPVIATIPNIVSVTHLKNTTFLITKNALYGVGRNGGDAMQIAYPDGAIALHGTSMPDLGAILILAENGRVYFFSPTTHRFSEEKFILPNAENVIDIAAASTYLYVLNRSENMLFRYPRAAGGFGSETRWFKEPVSIEPGTTISVGESVYIANGSGLHDYFRGTRQNTSFESSATPVFFTELSLDETVFILDGTAGRIVEYDAKKGSILNQYASKSLQGATHFTVDASIRTAFVSVGDTVLMADIQ